MLIFKVNRLVIANLRWETNSQFPDCVSPIWL